MATQEAIEALKQSWLKDPCWDIETTDGFEDHKAELLTFVKTVVERVAQFPAECRAGRGWVEKDCDLCNITWGYVACLGVGGGFNCRGWGDGVAKASGNFSLTGETL